MAHDFDVVIIGGGILGTSLSYFLSSLNKSKKIAVIEQANSVAFHTSGRNTGKVHAPYLYNPEKKKLFAKSAFHGYEMWEEYAKLKNLPFKEDGVIEVSSDQKGIKVLEIIDDRPGSTAVIQTEDEICAMGGVTCGRHKQVVTGKIGHLQKEGKIHDGKISFSPVKAVGTDCVHGDTDDFVQIDMNRSKN